VELAQSYQPHARCSGVLRPSRASNRAVTQCDSISDARDRVLNTKDTKGTKESILRKN
jgi:hypothetical protein